MLSYISIIINGIFNELKIKSAMMIIFTITYTFPKCDCYSSKLVLRRKITNELPEVFCCYNQNDPVIIRSNNGDRNLFLFFG